MARLRFPNNEDRFVYQTSASPNTAFLNVNGTVMRVFTDLACTIPADIQTYPGGVGIPTSEITVDGQSQLPAFLGPDGVDTLYVRQSSATTGNGYEIHAYWDTRLDAMEAQNAANIVAAQTLLASFKPTYYRNFLLGVQP